MRLTRQLLVEHAAALGRQDRDLRALVQRYGPPPLWSRPGGYATLAKIILEQQVSLASAATLYKRLEASIPGGFDAVPIRRVGVNGLRALGVTRQKSAYLVAAANAIEQGTLDLALLNKRSDADAMTQLVRVHGIGRWTASIYLIMAMRRPDVWPPGDLALHKAMQRAYTLERMPSSAEATERAERWAPYRAVAARILWHAYLEQAKDARTT